jgi:hypothetical protein
MDWGQGGARGTKGEIFTSVSTSIVTRNAVLQQLKLIPTSFLHNTQITPTITRKKEFMAKFSLCLILRS